jgi:hypothetical protein
MGRLMPRFTIRNLLIGTAWLCLWCAAVMYAVSVIDHFKNSSILVVIPFGSLIVAGPSVFIASLFGQSWKGLKVALFISEIWAFTVIGAWMLMVLLPVF